jgi:hypothetical protein
MRHRWRKRTPVLIRFVPNTSRAMTTSNMDVNVLILFFVCCCFHLMCQPLGRRRVQGNKPTKAPKAPVPGMTRPPKAPVPGMTRPPKAPVPGMTRPPKAPVPGMTKPPKAPVPGMTRPPKAPVPGMTRPPKAPTRRPVQSPVKT